MNAKVKIGFGLAILVVGIISYSKYIKPKANKSSQLPLAYDNSKISPSVKAAMGL